MQEYLGSRLQLERSALGSAAIAGRIQMKLLSSLLLGTKACQKERRRTGSYIC